MSEDAPHKDEVWVFKEDKMNTDNHGIVMGHNVRNIDMLKCFGEHVTIDAMFDNTTFITLESGNSIMMDTLEFLEFYVHDDDTPTYDMAKACHT